MLGRPRVHRVLWFTVWTAAVATTLSVLLGLPAAYALHRLAFPLRSVVRAALLVPFVLPTVVVGVAFRQLLGEAGPLGFLGFDGTPVAILAGLVFFNVAVVIRTVGAAWESLDRRPAEAAAALGASPAQVFRTVTLPGAAADDRLGRERGVPVLRDRLRRRAHPRRHPLLLRRDRDLPAHQGPARPAGGRGAVDPAAGRGGRAAGGRRPAAGGAGPDRRPGRPAARCGRGAADLPQLAATGLLLVLVAAPIVTLVVGSLRVDDAWSLDYYRALQTEGTDQALAVPVTTALLNSLRIAVDATWMSLLLGLLVAVAVTRRSHSRPERRIRGALDGAFMLPLGVSAVTLGFGFLITLDRPPLDLRDSALLVPIAQALVALPLVVRTLVPVLAASTTGSGRRRRRWAPGRCAPYSPSTCRRSGRRCWPRPGSRSRSRSASSGRRRSSPGRTGRRCRS